MKQFGLLLVLCMFLTTTIFIIVDIVGTKTTISWNSEVLKRLDRKHNTSRREIRKFDTLIRDMKKDPGIIDRKALKQYRMLRKDQYIIDDSTD